MNPNEAFVGVARAYCSWIESVDPEGERALTTARRLLARLYEAALNLEVKGSHIEIESGCVSHEDSVELHIRLTSLPFQYYANIFYPERLEEDKDIGDLADDLADIYCDLKNGLTLYDLGHTDEAVWEWDFFFRVHWGRHASSALHALHCYIVDREHDEA